MRVVRTGNCPLVQRWQDTGGAWWSGRSRQSRRVERLTPSRLLIELRLSSVAIAARAAARTSSSYMSRGSQRRPTETAVLVPWVGLEPTLNGF